MKNVAEQGFSSKCGFGGHREVGRLRADDDVVDGDVDQLDEEPDEAHDGEADGCGHSDLLELCNKNYNRLPDCRKHIVPVSNIGEKTYKMATVMKKDGIT